MGCRGLTSSCSCFPARSYSPLNLLSILASFHASPLASCSAPRINSTGGSFRASSPAESRLEVGGAGKGSEVVMKGPSRGICGTGTSSGPAGS
jgi:hypothetical protein